LKGVINMSNILVAYFSASGTTAAAAGKVAAALHADIFRIEPAVPYTKADLNWMDQSSRSSVEMNNKAFRPKIVKKPLDLTGYDTVLVGFPIWWYVAPTIINTFLESYDFSGKKIVLFATSGGSSFGNTVKELRASAPNAVIAEGKLLNRASEKQIADWVKTL